VGVVIYSEEFKEGAIKQVVEGGHPLREVAERLGVSQKSLYTWLRDRRARPRGSKQAESNDAMKAEIARLKAELKRTTEERNILRKAAAYFAKASDKVRVYP
jgi:transposase